MKIELKITDDAGNVHLYDVSGSLGFDKGYEQGYNDATREACKEIAKNYQPNDR